MDSIKVNNYKQRYVATVRFVDDNDFVIEGGMSEKRALREAKKLTDYCYVKDIVTKSEVKLILVNNTWIRQ